MAVRQIGVGPRPVRVGVPVGSRSVPVGVLVDEVDREQQLALGEHVRRASPSATMVWSSESTTMRSADSAAADRSCVAMTTVCPPPLPLVEHVEQPDLAARVEGVGGLVEQQHVRLHGEHRGDGDALLLAAAKRVRRPVEQVLDAQLPRRLAHAALDLLAGEAELQRAEGQLVEGVGAEELHVGLLEDEADARAELPAVRRVLERLLGERRAEGA